MKRKKPAPLTRYVVRLLPSRVVIWHVDAESLAAAEAISNAVIPEELEWLVGK